MRNTGPSMAVRNLVLMRDYGRCVVCWSQRAEQIQHRRPRGMGGSRDPRVNMPANLLSICCDCHRHAELNRSDSYDRGLLLHDVAAAEETPVLTDHRGLVRYFNDGTQVQVS